MEVIFLVVLSSFLFKQKTAYEVRISDWSSDVCSSDLPDHRRHQKGELRARFHILPKPHADFTQSALLWRAYDRVGKIDLGQMECGLGSFHSGFQTCTPYGDRKSTRLNSSH